MRGGCRVNYRETGLNFHEKRAHFCDGHILPPFYRKSESNGVAEKWKLCTVAAQGENVFGNTRGNRDLGDGHLGLKNNPSIHRSTKKEVFK